MQRLLAHGLAEGLILQQSNDSCGHGFSIIRWHQKAIPAFLNYLSNAVDLTRYGRNSAQESFYQ